MDMCRHYLFVEVCVKLSARTKYIRQICPISFKLYHMFIMQVTTIVYIFIIFEVIPLFVLRKRAIFGIEICPFLVTRKLEHCV